MNAKIQAAGAAGAATTILVWIAGAFFDVQVPPEVAAALTTLIATAAGWLKPETSPPNDRGLSLLETIDVLLVVAVVLLAVVVLT